MIRKYLYVQLYTNRGVKRGAGVTEPGTWDYEVVAWLGERSKKKGAFGWEWEP